MTRINKKKPIITFMTVAIVFFVLANVLLLKESPSGFTRESSDHLTPNVHREVEIEKGNDESPIGEEGKMEEVKMEEVNMEEVKIEEVKIVEDKDASPIAEEGASDLKEDTRTPAELIQMENDNAIKSKDKILSHLYVHIPKAGGFGFLTQLMTLMSQGGIFHGKGGENDQRGWAYRPCNTILGALNKFFTDAVPEKVNGVPCNLWMTEDEVVRSDFHSHAYTMIRSPVQHVISQYFHCTESSSHADRAHLMLGLDEWLDYHVERLEGAEDVMHVAKDPDPFRCYDPINLQSHFVNFNPEKDENDLVKEFDVIGVMDHFSQGVCAINIRYTGVVPPVCDCTNEGKRRRLGNIDHGVKHHGASFELTESQSSKITKLTALDSVLYSKAKLAFAQQVSDIEKDFGVTLCENPTISK